MAIDTTIVGTSGVGLQIQDPTTHTLAVSGITTSGTTTSATGLQLHDPTAYTANYGTGFVAALAAAVPIFFAGVAVIGVGLLTYAITKAALEPQA